MSGRWKGSGSPTCLTGRRMPESHPPDDRRTTSRPPTPPRGRRCATASPTSSRPDEAQRRARGHGADGLPAATPIRAARGSPTPAARSWSACALALVREGVWGLSLLGVAPSTRAEGSAARCCEPRWPTARGARAAGSSLREHPARDAPLRARGFDLHPTVRRVGDRRPRRAARPACARARATPAPTARCCDLPSRSRPRRRPRRRRRAHGRRRRSSCSSASAAGSPLHRDGRVAAARRRRRGHRARPAVVVPGGEPAGSDGARRLHHRRARTGRSTSCAAARPGYARLLAPTGPRAASRRARWHGSGAAALPYLPSGGSLVPGLPDALVAATPRASR